MQKSIDYPWTQIYNNIKEHENTQPCLKGCKFATGGKKLRYEECEVRHDELDEEESEDVRPEWSEEYLNSLGMSMSDFV